MYKKSMVFVFSILIPVSLISCVILETYIDNDEYEYDVFPITSDNNFLAKINYILGDYELTYSGDVKYEGDYGTIETSEYVFYEKDREVCKLEVTETFRKGYLIFGELERHVKIINKNGINNEYKMNNLHDTDSRENFLVFLNDNNGSIIVKKYYRAVNKNKPEYFDNYHLGYEFIVNDKRYGILALEPRAFHLVRNNIMDRNMALYILAAFVSER